jgi:hypothetical protein
MGYVARSISRVIYVESDVVEIVRCECEPDQEAAVFTVYKTKKGVISGDIRASAQTGELAAAFCIEPHGLPVEEAFQRAVSFCERYNIPTLFVKDPDGLWPDGGKAG